MMLVLQASLQAYAASTITPQAAPALEARALADLLSAVNGLLSFAKLAYCCWVLAISD
jgi:hypothetical protein